MRKTKLEKRVDNAEYNIEVNRYDIKWTFVLALVVLAIVLFLVVMSADRFSRIEAQFIPNESVSWKCVDWEEIEVPSYSLTCFHFNPFTGNINYTKWIGVSFRTFESALSFRNHDHKQLVAIHCPRNAKITIENIIEGGSCIEERLTRRPQ